MPNTHKLLSLAEEEMWNGFSGLGWKDEFVEFVRHKRAGLLSSAALLLSGDWLNRLRKFTSHIEAVFADPAYRSAFAPLKEAHPGLIGYDLHLTVNGPQLIEINTNPGGLLLNLAHAEMASRLSPDLAIARSGDFKLKEIKHEILASFLTEWRSGGRENRPSSIAIIDKNPPEQYLWPEFLLYRDLFVAAGIPTLIADPAELEIKDNVLLCQGQKIDLVYNRLTDFPLREPANSVLAEAWENDRALLIPDPPSHALYADKVNLIHLSQRTELKANLPMVCPVSAELWPERRRFFFKPRDGFAGRGAYRGDKLSKGKWEEILRGDYIAQEYSPPPICRLPGIGDFKFDVRLYAKQQKILLAAARIYNGQTTNFRTPHGGFAPIFFG
jgi:hypothetical protein